MVEFEHVTKVYDNGFKALNDISIHIDKGEFAFIVGASGAGKSTFTKLLIREETVTDGRVLIDGVNVASLKRREIPYHRRQIGMVFQDFRLLPNRSVFDNVAFAMRIIGTSERQIRRTVPALLQVVGLASKAKVQPHQLSGGEQQRVSLARAIANNPKLLIADEPTGNLDPTTAVEIMKVLEEINQRGTTVIVATHAKEIVDQMKKRVIAIDNGVIVRDDQKGVYGYEG